MDNEGNQRRTGRFRSEGPFVYRREFGQNPGPGNRRAPRPVSVGAPSVVNKPRGIKISTGPKGN